MLKGRSATLLFQRIATGASSRGASATKRTGLVLASFLEALLWVCIMRARPTKEGAEAAAEFGRQITLMLKEAVLPHARCGPFVAPLHQLWASETG